MRYLVALLMLVVLTLVPTAAQAETVCVQFEGQVFCGELVEPIEAVEPVPTVTLTLPPVPPVTLPPITVTDLITIPGPTIRVPQPTDTVTIRVPSDKETIYISGPTVTDTVTAPGGISRTPQATATTTETETVTETPEPVTVTETVKPEPKPGKVVELPSLSLPEAVGYSALALLAFALLIVLGMWLGYIMGYKDSDREEKKFLEALRDQFYYKGKHS